jgi:uncharacterized protein YjiK
MQLVVKQHHLIRKIFFLILMMALFGSSVTAFAEPTVPLMVAYLDTGGFGASSLTGVAFISTTGNFAVLDDQADQVFITDPTGILQSKINLGFLLSDSASGITFIPSSDSFAIVDNGVKRVFIIDSAGNRLGQFETSPFGSIDPQGITYVTTGIFAGNLAILDNTVQTVFIVDLNGNLQAFFSAPKIPLAGITFISDNATFAVVDDDSNDVKILNSVGTVLDTFNVGFVSTDNRGIAYNSATGYLIVASDGEDEIFSFNVEGQLFGKFSTSAFGSNQPSGITYLPPTNNFAIVDSGQHEVFFVAADGTKESQCNISGFSDFASGITYISATDNLAVLDENQDQVFIFDTGCNQLVDQFDIGTFGINALDAKGITSVPGGLSPAGQFEIVDSETDAAIRIDPARPGRIQSQFSTRAFGFDNPEGIALIGDTDNFAVVDSDAAAVSIIGSKGDLRGKFDISEFTTAARGIAFDSDNHRVAIVDSDVGQVVIFDLPGLVELPITTSCLSDFDNDDDVDGSDLFEFSIDDVAVPLQRFASEFGSIDCSDN